MLKFVTFLLLTLSNASGGDEIALLQDIRRTLYGLTERMDTVDDKLDTLKRKISEMDNGISGMEGNLQTNIGRIKTRQEAQLNEVRLISLYKMTSSSSVHGDNGHVSNFAVDGQFQESQWAPSTHLRTMFHSPINPGQSLKIDLGALFRIHRVSVHNARHCSHCMERLIGTKILADDRLLGVAIRKKFVNDFDVPAGDAVYARSITLRQELTQYLNILEVQVWGTGPFNDSDKFA